MKEVRIILLVSLIAAFSSCIKDEMLHSEADILTCTVQGTVLKRQPRISNDKIVLMVKSNADLQRIAPVFTLTRGATIFPESGTPLDFSSPQYYTVTSEDRHWKKVYEVSCDTSALRKKYDFEHFELDTKQHYYLFYEMTENGSKQYLWSCGNELFDLIAAGSDPDNYPTTVSDAGKSGMCLKLQTKSTGVFGSWSDKPIAAGSLFMGEFESDSALIYPLKATRFGTPIDFLPSELTGYYRYKAGVVYTDKKGKIVPGAKDNFDIYAVLFETDAQLNTLDGANVLTSPSIIAIARIGESDRIESDEWRMFKIPFVYKQGKQIDLQKLEDDKYSLTVVFSSSIAGDLFRGSVGSTLYIDEVVLSEKTDQ
ncbi:MAG: PCMD domain-containing protein [Bacteroidales bacterium]|nr:PCMD domain-containing protein [Bacteroidales bacterium]MDD4822791.1 PCMD domain-containing protein [Bacteroidales bacterium]